MGEHKSRPGWITSPWTRAAIIAAMLAGQAAVIGGAWVMAVRTEVSGSARAADSNAGRLTAGMAEGIAAAVAKLAANTEHDADADPLERGTPAWSRTQQILAGFAADAGTIIEIVSADGHVLCSPDMSPLPGFDHAPAPTPRAGRTASAPIPGSDATVIVMAREHPAEPATAGTMGTAITAGTMVVGAAVLLLSAIGCAALVSVHGRRLHRQNALLTDRLTEQNAEVVRTRNAMIFGLAKLADYRDSDTGDHLDRICTYCTLLARELQPEFDEIDNDFITTLSLAASMHDIGKVGVPDRVLLKPGRLNADEMAVVKTHPRIGAETLIAIRDRFGHNDEMLCMSIDIALRHHERWDGAGYPDGLAGAEIPLAARIVSVADVYDALTSERVYKAAMDHGRAVELIKGGAGTQFDPDVVAAFETLAHEFNRIRREIPDRPSLRAAA